MDALLHPLKLWLYAPLILVILTVGEQFPVLLLCDLLHGNDEQQEGSGLFQHIVLPMLDHLTCMQNIARDI